jgi:hypothetical protein
MHMTLERLQIDKDVTIGALSIDGHFECWTLEDPVREVPGKPVTDWKIKGKTAIPYGTYAVQITYSQRFGRPLPLLIAVPGFTAIRIHAGNTVLDTEGCPLVGTDRHARTLGRSRMALDALIPKIDRALKLGVVAIEVVEGVRP